MLLTIFTSSIFEKLLKKILTYTNVASSKYKNNIIDKIYGDIIDIGSKQSKHNSFSESVLSMNRQNSSTE